MFFLDQIGLLLSIGNNCKMYNFAHFVNSQPFAFYGQLFLQSIFERICIERVLLIEVLTKGEAIILTASPDTFNHNYS